ncbi:YqaJ viral recombinase family protein [Actinomadura sp. LCR2-06]|uniref:YqaJ viral recombinase family protein n=2 Tax=Actinomadura violacea TaxID=2819934 RepID=A0ABS3RYP6_9ACTN|nr:YqaJ viral recombinase family protein [Actinomadura violacea]
MELARRSLAGHVNRPRSTVMATPTGRLLLPPRPRKADWDAARAQRMTASRIAACMGLEKGEYSSPLAVWHEMRGTRPNTKPARVREAARWGQRMEPVIAEAFAEESHHGIRPNPGMLVHADADWMGANLDFLVVQGCGCGNHQPGMPTDTGDVAPCCDPETCEACCDHCPTCPSLARGRRRRSKLRRHQVAPPKPTAFLECKQRSAYQDHEWGDDEDSIPDSVALQVHWGLAVSGLEAGYVAVLLGGNHLKWYRIERDEEFLANLVEWAKGWYDTHVIGGVEPDVDGSKATTELLNHLWRVKPGTVTLLDAQETKRLQAAKDAIKDRIKAEEENLREVENRLRRAMGDAEIGMVDGHKAVSWCANGTFNRTRFAEDHPDLAAEYVTTAEVFDLDRFKEERPDLYGQYRARVLRTHKPPKPKAKKPRTRATQAKTGSPA